MTGIESRSSWSRKYVAVSSAKPSPNRPAATTEDTPNFVAEAGYSEADRFADVAGAVRREGQNLGFAQQCNGLSAAS